MIYSWWVFQIAMTMVAFFFFGFGINLMIGAYTALKDPFSFIMTFFAASFMILISLTLAITFIIKMVRVFKKLKDES